MHECVFCKIVVRELPAAVVFEDDDVMAVMTVEAVNVGHTLVIPKKHVPSFDQLEDELYGKIMSAAKKLAEGIRKTYNPPKVGLAITGWEVDHTHIHVLPIYKSGDIISKQKLENKMLFPGIDERASEAEKIKSSLV